ncbi:hypothetical protein [Methylacidiphilum caldifontis]|uniref:Uncharacterized protein n=1 Tax=Methylacidiphilum caldifontis TaxID=2795386 RepID=A0A4Y8P7F0_9BACT|nr:hypothetical protein [Methylacidiphilum caldifontis]QSR88905.1 hypothetical protein IT6_00935 [Methylacidiphilum caldifontis]TFE66187.1 hypothetical protein A7Q10_02310 [Methylacidiphilum caldifontis]
MNYETGWPEPIRKWAIAVSQNLIEGFWIKAYEEFWPDRWPDGSVVYSQESETGEWFLLRENAWNNYGYENFEQFAAALLSKTIRADSPSKILMVGLYRNLIGTGFLRAIRGSIFSDQKLIMNFIVVNEDEFQKVRSLAHKIDFSCRVQREFFYPELLELLRKIIFSPDNTKIRLLRLGVFFGFFCVAMSIIALFWKKGIFLAILSQFICLWIFWRIGKEYKS